MPFNDTKWEIPNHLTYVLKEKSTKYCICIPIINEGNRIINQLTRMNKDNIHLQADIIICDCDSSDGSTEITRLKSLGVRTLLIKKDSGVVGAQLRMGYAYALKEGYSGIITMDGNDKDGHDVIPRFIKKLELGYDYVQGSRYIKNGQSINTPFIRHIAINYVHKPIINLISGYKYTDTTNGNRAYSKNLLCDEKIQPFRNVFYYYDFLVFVSSVVPKYGFKMTEVPMTRKYPKGETPTKISWYGNLRILKSLFYVIIRKYRPKNIKGNP